MTAIPGGAPAPVISLHSVSPDGRVSLVAANLPYSSLLWTRRFSKPGEFRADLACALPAPWPGRYLVTADGRGEVGVAEKVECDESTGRATVSGRFAECLWGRYAIPPTGAAASGADWRQCATEALIAWHMPDLPELRPSTGTERATGSSYSVSGGPGDRAADLIYSVTAANGARPLASYDRAAGDFLSLSIVDGRDLTRSQSERPWHVFSLGLATALEVSYCGDYSSGCSEVVAYAAPVGTGGEEPSPVEAAVPVPGFDASAQWLARAVEDVSSLTGASDGVPTAAEVSEAGRLRAYDHMPAVGIDCTAYWAGYMSEWDLGDTCETELPSLSLVAVQRIEEARETHDRDGSRLEVTVGTKTVSKVARAAMGRR